MGFEPGQLAAFAFSGLFCAMVLELARRVCYPLVWLTFSTATLILCSAAYPLILRITTMLGFAYPRSALCSLAFAGLVLAALHHSNVITRADAENAKLCHRVAILEVGLRHLTGPTMDASSAPIGPR